eukprot:Amastigsp_a176599_15.p5 type:complete len:102 gc:universal Amastigsp_a176599_15:1136-831(-)
MPNGLSWRPTDVTTALGLCAARRAMMASTSKPASIAAKSGANAAAAAALRAPADSWSVDAHRRRILSRAVSTRSAPSATSNPPRAVATRKVAHGAVSSGST